MSMGTVGTVGFLGRLRESSPLRAPGVWGTASGDELWEVRTDASPGVTAEGPALAVREKSHFLNHKVV